MVSNVVPMRLSAAKAREMIKSLANDSSKIVWTGHGKIRKGQRSITRKQVINCLLHGAFIEQPCYDVIHGGFKFTMQTRDSGDLINVAAALHKNDNGDYVVVITVFRR